MGRAEDSRSVSGALRAFPIWSAVLGTALDSPEDAMTILEWDSEIRRSLHFSEIGEEEGAIWLWRVTLGSSKATQSLALQNDLTGRTVAVGRAAASNGGGDHRDTGRL